MTMQYIEKSVMKARELAGGQMKQVEVGPVKVLLTRLGDAFHAVGGTCPHYGAPLAEGVLSGDRVVCPWHQSHFSVITGEFHEPPTFDCLPRYHARVEGEDVIVRVPATWADRVAPAMARHDLHGDDRTFVVLGAGAAGFMAAQTLRQAGVRGRVVLVGPEGRLPYDRPNLSKDYLGAKPLEQPLQLRDLDFYRERGIELVRARATEVDPAAKSVALDGAPPLRYDRLLLATGGRPRTLDVPGAGLGNVFTLRSYDDANAILAAARPGMRAVVVGAGFIGMETAASLTERGLSVTVVAPEAVPFEKQLGRPIGEMFQRLHESRGVQFRLGTRPARIEGADAVSGVELDSGEPLAADLVLAGVGIVPNTEFLRDILRDEHGLVTVDRHLRAFEDVWAAGDITRFPYPPTGELVHIEHWRLAEQHGRVAALNMADRPTAFEAMPYFWSFQFGVGLDYVGFAQPWDEILTDGDVEKQDFTCFYVRGGEVLAAAGCGRSRQMCALSELMRRGRTPAPAEARGADFVGMLAEA